MYVLPLLKREMWVAARRPLTFRLRTGFGAGILALSTWSILIWGSSVSFSGGAFFTILFWVTEVAALVTGILVAAESVSRERREGTLPLLFLTDLTVSDLVLGKLAAIGVVPLFTLVSIFPSLAIWQLLGGLPIEELWRAVLVLLVTLFVSTAVTLFVSSITSKRATTVLGSVLILCLFNPLYLAFLATWLPSPKFSVALLAFCVLGTLFLIATGIVLRKNWRDDSQPTKGEKCRQLIRRGGIDENFPITSMLLRSSISGGAVHWMGRSAAVIGAAMILWMTIEKAYIAALAGLFGFHLVYFLTLAGRTASSFSRKLQEGAFEILLSTPLDNKDIFEGFARFLRLHCRTFLVLLSAFDLLMAALLWAKGVRQLVVFPLAMSATLWISFLGLIWVGVYRSFMMETPLLSAFWTFWRLSFFPMALSALFLWAPKTNYLKVCFFWVASTGFLALFFGTDARRVLLERGRELLLRPASDKPPHIENEWSFINWEGTAKPEQTALLNGPLQLVAKP